MSVANIVTKEARFVSLASHYKDTFEFHIKTIKDRNRLFFYLLIILVFFLVQFKDSSLIQQLCNSLLQKNTGANLQFAKFTPVLLWFLLMGTSLRYFQINIQIERQYSYIHSLEEELNKHYPNSAAFTREGRSYLSDYPIFSNWLCFLYAWVFPLALLGAVITRMYVDITSWPPTYLDITCFIAYEITGASTILYLIGMHKRR